MRQPHERDDNWWEWALYDDVEFVSCSEINRQIECKEWRAKYPNADLSLVEHFESLLDVAEQYHSDTGRHLAATYGDIGELYAAITHGIELNRNFAQGADGRVGNDHVEVKTIAPFSKSEKVEVKRSGNFNKLFLVKIDKEFQVAGRMVDRKNLPKGTGKTFKVRWSDLPPLS